MFVTTSTTSTGRSIRRSYQFVTILQVFLVTGLFVATTRFRYTCHAFATHHSSILFPSQLSFSSFTTSQHTPPLVSQRDIGWTRIRTKKTKKATTTTTASATRSSIIGIDDVWGNWAVLTGLASLAQFLGRTTRWGQLMGGPVTAMAGAFVAATIGLLTPGGTPAAQSMQLLALQLATPMILLSAEWRKRRLNCGGSILVSFAVASVGTYAASWMGWHLVGRSMQNCMMGEDGLKIAAALLAKNIGGGINYMAVCSSLGASGVATAAGLCVDNLFALLYFPFTSFLAQGRPDVVSSEKYNNIDDPTTGSMQGDASVTIHLATTNDSTMSVQTISTVIFLSAALLWLGERIGGASGCLPVCTLLSILTATLAPYQWIQSLRPTAENLGLTALYLFFATAGAPGILVAKSVRAALVPIGLYLTCLYSLHGLLLFVCYKVLGISFMGGAFLPQRLLVASSAAIGGPATAVALTTSAQWPSLSVPGILVGNVGYAVATFCGLAFYNTFSY